MKTAKQELVKVTDDPDFQEAQQKVFSMQRKEKDIIAQIEGVKKRGDDTGRQARELLDGKSLEVAATDGSVEQLHRELRVVRKAVKLAEGDAQKLREAAERRIITAVEGEGRDVAKRTFDALAVLADAAEAEKEFYKSVRRLGVSDLTCPMKMRLNSHVAKIVFMGAEETSNPNNILCHYTIVRLCCFKYFHTCRCLK